MNIESEELSSPKWSPISVERSWMYRCTAGDLNWPILWICSAKTAHSESLTLILPQARSPILKYNSSAQHQGRRIRLTLRSPSKFMMDELTTSSVNSGNSFRHRRKLVTSSARFSNCSGKLSRLKFSETVGLGTCSCAFPLTCRSPRLLRLVGESTIASLTTWLTFWGKSLAAFSW